MNDALSLLNTRPTWGMIRALNNIVRSYKRRQAMEFRKLSGKLLMEFYGYASQKHRSTMGQVGIIRKKKQKSWRPFTGSRRQLEDFTATSLKHNSDGSGPKYRFDKFTVLTDSRSVKVTVDAQKHYKNVKLPRQEILPLYDR